MTNAELLKKIENGESIKDVFKLYYQINNKNTEYELNSEEGVRKYKNFKSNIQGILRHNKENANTYTMGITKYTDLQESEWVAMHKNISDPTNNRRN